MNTGWHLSDTPEINGKPAVLSTYVLPAGSYRQFQWDAASQTWSDLGFVWQEARGFLDLPASEALTELEHGSDWVAVYDGLDGIAENLGSATKFAETKGIQNLTVNQHVRSNWIEEHSFYLT